jgi:predicted acetyltransferase
MELWTMLREIGPGENGYCNDGYDVPFSRFESYLQRRVDMRNGRGLRRGRVPMTTYWLFDGERPVGVSKLRHHLNDSLRRVGGHIGYCVRPTERRKGYGTAMLGLTLGKARARGIGRVLITCREDNLPSRRIIEKNGGVLERVRDGICHYWITTGPVASGPAPRVD